jgi:hypothetical protein
MIATLYMIHLFSRKGVTLTKKITRTEHVLQRCKKEEEKRFKRPGDQSPLTPTLLLQAWQTGPEGRRKVTRMSETWNSQDRYARHMMLKWRREHEHPRWKWCGPCFSTRRRLLRRCQSPCSCTCHARICERRRPDRQCRRH